MSRMSTIMNEHAEATVRTLRNKAFALTERESVQLREAYRRLLSRNVG